MNFAFTRFDTEQWWDGFSWWFWTRAFSSHEHTFWYGLFVLFCLFKTFLLLISLPWMWLGRGAWQPYEISHAHDRRSIGKKRIITYGLDENRSAIFKAWKQGIRKRARNYKLKDLQKKKEAGGCFERQENKERQKTKINGYWSQSETNFLLVFWFDFFLDGEKTGVAVLGRGWMIMVQVLVQKLKLTTDIWFSPMVWRPNKLSLSWWCKG